MTPAGDDRRELIAIVGATATGKTAASIELAQAVGGEIVNADSRQMYRGLDIGTAKPTLDEQRTARHWLIDVADPDEPLTLATFLDLARAALDDIWSRGLRPILCGGTGQYVWALLEGWDVPRVPPDAELRARLDERAAREGVESLMVELRAIDPASAATIDARNPRRIIRAIEVTLATGRPFSAWRTKSAPSFSATVVGLRLGREALHRRIDARVDAMMAAGFVEEVQRLNSAGYGCELQAMRSIGYAQICAHLRGELLLPEAVARIKIETHRLARMQHTWFRDDDPRIGWVDAASASVTEDVVAAAARRA